MSNVVPVSPEKLRELKTLATFAISEQEIDQAVDFTCFFVESTKLEHPHFRELLKMAVLYVLGGKPPDGYRTH